MLYIWISKQQILISNSFTLLATVGFLGNRLKLPGPSCLDTIVCLHTIVCLMNTPWMQECKTTSHKGLLCLGSGRESETDSGDDKLSHHSSSPESGICNSCDRQSLASAQLPARVDIEALAWGNVTHTGGRLTVADTGELA